MEAAQLSPPDGERPGDPGALEAGDTEPNGGNEANGGTQRCEDNEGPHDPRAGVPGIWNDETSRARDADGSRNPRAGRSEGPQDAGPGKGDGDCRAHGDAGARSIEGARTWRDETTGASYSAGTDASSGEGPRARTDETAVTTRSSKGPDTVSNEGPQTDEIFITPRINKGPGTVSSEGPRTDETPVSPRIKKGTGTISSEGPRTDEAALSPRINKGTGTTSSEGPQTDETPLSPRINKGTGTTSSEGPRTDETPLSPRINEGPRTDETPLPHRSSKGVSTATSEGPGNPGSITGSSEESGNPGDGAHEAPNDARDCSDQRITRSRRLKETYAARSSNEGPHDVSPAKSWHAGAKDPPKQPHAESSEGGNGPNGSTLEGAESFKKPIAPLRPSWNEKTLDQHDQLGSATLPSISSRETAPDVSARLPSDAYRSNPAIPYREPSWAGWPPTVYSLEVLKGGSILATKSLNGSSWTIFGRLPTCHVSLEHPSVSRYHAVLQYRAVPGTEPDQEPGFYVYDLGSTHGTFINKQRIQSKTYCRIRVGHVLKFGGSTRLFILQGPDEDQEDESELTVTQIKEARRQKESLQKRMLGDDSDEEDNPEEEGEAKKEPGRTDEAGCTWGMGEDAEEEENDVNPIAMEYQAEREALYSGNPKKALQGYFDREGEELEFEYEGRGIGSWLCSVKYVRPRQ